jgi:hypothetical protein
MEHTANYSDLSDENKLAWLKSILMLPPEYAYYAIVAIGLAPDVFAIGKAKREDKAVVCGISSLYAFKGIWIVACAWHDECYLEVFSPYFLRHEVDSKFYDIQCYVAKRAGKTLIKPKVQYAVVRAVGGFYWEGLP